MADCGNDRHDEGDAPGTDTRRAGGPGRGGEWTAEERAKETLSGLVAVAVAVAVVWQNHRTDLQHREADPTVERRQPSITISLRARCARALNTEL